MRLLAALAVAVAALVLAAPAGTATADKPVPGGTYTYKKTLKKWKEWRSPESPYDILGVEVGRFGSTVRVGWSLYTGHGCTSKSASGSTAPYQDGTILERVSVKGDGSFHAVQRPKLGPGVKYSVFEARGRFLDNGKRVQVSIRHRFYGYLPNVGSTRCDGRWTIFRIPLDKG